MDNFPKVISSALEYYDDNSMIYYDKVRTFKYYTILQKSNTMIFFDENKIKIYESQFDVIGKFITAQNIWVWGWSSSELSKNMIVTSKKVLNYALDLDLDDVSLKTMLITSRTQITSQTQLDINIAITSFLSKQPLIFQLNYMGDYNTNMENGSEFKDKETDDTQSPYENANIFEISHKSTPIAIYYFVLANK